MKTRLILTCCYLFTCFIAFSQEDYRNWKSSPERHAVKQAFEKESAVVLEDSRVYEYKLDEKNDMWIYHYKNKIIKLNDDKGVEMYNKTYVYIPYNAKVEEIKARTILPNGKVVNLPAEKIFDEEDEGKTYKKFAFEGIEKGSTIEYFLLYKQVLSTFGLEIYQSPSPVEKASFTLVAPEHLVFDVKGYNGFTVEPVVIKDKKRMIRAFEKDIENLDDDKYASPAPYQKNIQFKLSYNLDKNKDVRLYSWSELAKNVYNNYHTYSSSEQKAINNFYKQIKFPDNSSDEAKIIAIEDYIKTNINSDENMEGEDADKIESIFKSKVTSEYGFKRLMMALFQKAELNYQIVFPSQRDEIGIDEEFENYRLIDESLLYFPSTGKFLDPLNASLRYPFVNPYYAGTKGLFLKGTTIGDFKTALPSFDTIPLEPFETTFSNLFVNMQFNESMDSMLLHSKQSVSGYYASVYRPAYMFLAKDKQQDFTKEVIKAVTKSDNITNIKVENSAMTDGSKGLPLNIIADITTADLNERAGNKLLVKIGEAIGPQEQMYQEKKRKLPVLLQYPHALDRILTFKIPSGYRVKNLQDINKNVTDARQSMGFVSSYTLKGSELEITIHEYYKEVHYPLSEFEEYRKVVNASADFNKVVLVLEKI